MANHTQQFAVECAWTGLDLGLSKRIIKDRLSRYYPNVDSEKIFQEAIWRRIQKEPTEKRKNGKPNTWLCQ